ncbi:MAG: type 1 glutamine amidotransferase [Spirochaetia bacterium]|nr:type 1 glutamine amidotransferase [Spirochaetia bacterium]
MSLKKILIIQNITREGPGLFEKSLNSQGIKYEIVDLSLNEEIPLKEKYGAVVVLGGPDSVNDNTKKIENQLKYVKKILAEKIPYLGICLGLQVLVKAAGGIVIKSKIKEIGFRDLNNNLFSIHLTKKGEQDQMFHNIKNNLEVFQLHGETVELTENMNLLGRGEFCKNQIIKIGENAYGFQCHFELTSELLESWMKEDLDLSRLNKKKLREDFNLLKDEFSKNGFQIFNNFLKIAGF